MLKNTQMKTISRLLIIMILSVSFTTSSCTKVEDEDNEIDPCQCGVVTDTSAGPTADGQHAYYVHAENYCTGNNQKFLIGLEQKQKIGDEFCNFNKW